MSFRGQQVFRLLVPLPFLLCAFSFVPVPLGVSPHRISGIGWVGVVLAGLMALPLLLDKVRGSGVPETSKGTADLG